MQYEINNSGYVKTCFPEGLDTSDFIDVTDIRSPWAKFLDPKTGKIHNCEDYYKQAMGQYES